VSQKAKENESLIAQGARNLIARARDDHSLAVEALIPRIRAAVDKYLLKDDADPSSDSITDFIEKLQADDLCLIVACEQGNQQAWSDLVERFSVTVRSAARSASSNEEGGTAWAASS
jgi:hypothetical protein